MELELKTALDAQSAAIDAVMKKYEGQQAENGKVDDEIRAEVKALSEKFEKSVTEIAQKMDTAEKGSSVIVTAGAEFIKSDEFKALCNGSVSKARIEVKNTILGDATTSYPMQRQGIIPGNFLPLTLRDVIPSITVTTNAVNALRELAYTNAAAETAHGAAKPESSLTFENYDVNIRTVAHWLKVSKQLLDDAPAVAAYIDTRLRDGLAQRIDRQLLLGDGTSPNISGLTDAGNFTAFTALTGANLVESINRAKYQMWAAGNAPDTVIVNPADWGAMELLREGAGTGAYMYGAPGTVAGISPFGVNVVMSSHMPVGFFVVAALRTSATVFNRSGAVVEAGYVNDDFTRNLVTLRAEERLALAVDRPAGVYYGDFSL